MVSGLTCSSKFSNVGTIGILGWVTTKCWLRGSPYTLIRRQWCKTVAPSAESDSVWRYQTLNPLIYIYILHWCDGLEQISPQQVVTDSAANKCDGQVMQWPGQHNVDKSDCCRAQHEGHPVVFRLFQVFKTPDCHLGGSINQGALRLLGQAEYEL